jgi:hypothetical protein
MATISQAAKGRSSVAVDQIAHDGEPSSTLEQEVLTHPALGGRPVVMALSAAAVHLYKITLR